MQHLFSYGFLQVLGSEYFFFFHGPIRSDDQPPVPRPCCTSYQSSQFIAISCVPRYSLHAFIHPFCDAATV